MEWKDLAPWIAIAVTLILSILVPLFTQIANNRHQRLMEQERRDFEQKQKKQTSYESFLLDVGAVITGGNYSSDEARVKAGASLHQMYIYAQEDWYNRMDELASHIREFEWDKAKPIMEELSRLISKELRK